MKYRIIICLALLALVGASLPVVRAQTPNRAGLIVRFGDGSVTTRCIEFSESEINGYDLLTRSGLDIVEAFDPGQGAAICSIEGEGCPASSCLTCDVPNYWSYWHLVDGAWVYSQIGASNRTVHAGDVDGWRWGSGDPPPVVPFDQICTPPPTTTATATPQPTDTPPPPTATATATPQPTNTPIPQTATATPQPTDTPAPVVWFRLDENPIAAGTCTTVRWDTANVQEIYLDEERVAPNSSREVCPAASQEYQLRVVSAEGEKTHTLVLGVTGAAPTATAMPQSTAPATATATTVPPSPTSPPGAISPTLPTPTVPPMATTPAPPSARSGAGGSGTMPTPAQIAARSPSPLPEQIGQPQPIPTSSSAALPTSSDEESAEPFFPTSYIIFSLIAGGLLGWLVFVITNRNEPKATCTE